MSGTDFRLFVYTATLSTTSEEMEQSKNSRYSGFLVDFIIQNDAFKKLFPTASYNRTAGGILPNPAGNRKPSGKLDFPVNKKSTAKLPDLIILRYLCQNVYPLISRIQFWITPAKNSGFPNLSRSIRPLHNRCTHFPSIFKAR